MGWVEWQDQVFISFISGSASLSRLNTVSSSIYLSSSVIRIVILVVKYKFDVGA